MKRRSLTWVLSAAMAGGLGFALRASAQPAAGVPRIGVLRWGAAGDDAQLDLRAALAALGYREGETLLVEWRFARTGDQARRHATELAALDLELIVASATPAAAALRDVAKSVPIVLSGVADPLGARLVATLARPGGQHHRRVHQSAGHGAQAAATARRIEPWTEACRLPGLDAGPGDQPLRRAGQGGGERTGHVDAGGAGGPGE